MVLPLLCKVAKPWKPQKYIFINELKENKRYAKTLLYHRSGVVWYRHSQLKHPELEFNTFLKRRNEKILSPPTVPSKNDLCCFMLNNNRLLQAGTTCWKPRSAVHFLWCYSMPNWQGVCTTLAGCSYPSSELFASMSGDSSAHSYHLPFHLRLFHKEQLMVSWKCIVLALVLGAAL